ncbi:Gluconate 2-dehydrogenase subunit 3 [Raineyella antarctica]|uniref:Gluconate 2-dehydrogenase subunit 3 n=1 Tax=Raineyella antarctica TaxID=1577474 RepID=A0A1G6HHK7_9ACTN|nr:gluconate 2-dehydrogenase subunit 3 family protein [Raineyella antarctica]SDB92926.1 Gluconate 2-dehydrogenase subunit 3 [Raineyella antarctica]
MNGLPLSPEGGGGRYPGFTTVDQADHWDKVTEGVVLSRLGRPVDIRFFTPREEAIATALFDRLLDQQADPRIPIVNMVDSRLAESQTDGWRYADMPEDGQAWRETLAALDEDANDAYGHGFPEASRAEQAVLLDRIQDLASKPWHGMTASRVWSLWTRYACTAFYSHPWAWDEIGFPGPAYPRGYKNLGVDRREPFEVADIRPEEDPIRAEENP